MNETLPLQRSALIAQRLTEQSALLQKAALARSAATVIKSGDIVFLDCGSTNLELVPFLREGLTVATDSIDIAAALAQRPDIHLMLIGGMVTSKLGGSADAAAAAAVGRLNIDCLFLGACAIGAPTGVSAFDCADVAQPLLEAGAPC